jgi:hypothetical protein
MTMPYHDVTQRRPAWSLSPVTDRDAQKNKSKYKGGSRETARRRVETPGHRRERDTRKD